MGLKLSNLGASVLDGPVGTGDVTITVASGHGAKFPALGAGDWFPAVLRRVSDGAVEIAYCTARSGDALTVTRAQESTTALAFVAGDKVELCLTAGAFALNETAYVNATGDSMTGPLAITSGSTPQVLTKTGSYKDASVQYIPNSEFADATSWTLSGGWQISGGKLINPSNVPGNISVPVTGLVPGASYVVEFGVTADYAYWTLQATGYPAQSYWRSWESVKHIGYIADASNITLQFIDRYRTAAVQIDYIRMYRVVANAERVQQGKSATSPTFDLVASGSSFGLGQNALKNSANALDSIAIGNYALAVAVRPYGAIAIGSGAMMNSPSPKENIAIGVDAGRYIKAGSDNVIIGAWGTVSYNTPTGPGNGNTVVGTYACSSITGSQNSAFGYGTLQGLQSGSNNVAVGNHAGMKLNGNSNANTLIGNAVLGGSSTAGAYSTMVGLGHNAFNNTPYSNSMCLGANSAVTGANQNQIGASGTTTYAYGAVQDRSDRRDKRDVRDTALGLNFIMALRPVDFKWDMREDYRTEPPTELATRQGDLQRLIADLRTLEPTPAAEIEAAEAALAEVDAQLAAHAESNRLANITTDGSKARRRFHHGFIAQEVQGVMAASGIDFGGFQDHSIKGGDDVLSLGYIEFIAPLVRALQEQQSMIEALQARLTAAGL